MLQKLVPLSLAAFFVLNLLPASASDLNDGQGWVDDDTVDEMLPGGASLIEVQRTDPIDQASEADYYRSQNTFYPGSYSAGNLQQTLPQIGSPYQNSAPATRSIEPASAAGPGTIYNSTDPSFASNAPPKKQWVFEKHPVPWLNALGRGARSVGRGAIHTAEDTSNFVSSPDFIDAATGLAAVGGAGYGLYKLNRSSSQSSGYGYTNPNEQWVNRRLKNGESGYWRTRANNTTLDNFSTRGNYNYHTGQFGTKSPW